MERQIELVHIQPGKPTQNARVESFHGRLREECLSVSWFQNLFEARRKIAAWKREYNEERQVAPPETGMTSCVLHKDERFNITLFGFAAGHELKTHSVPIPALIYVVEGEGEFDLGSETVQVKSGSFIRMEALLPHAVRAKSPFRMLVVQVKDRGILK